MTNLSLPTSTLYTTGLGNHARVWVTQCNDGVAQTTPYAGNLALHVNDDAEQVLQRRKLLTQRIGADIQWLNQVHGTHVQIVSSIATQTPTADASLTQKTNLALGILTADCVPVMFAAQDGSCVAAVHAGWRGLLDGVLENTINAMRAHGCNAPVLAHIGPCIGVAQFEVGEEVFAAFAKESHLFKACFTRNTANTQRTTYLCDLERIVRIKLSHAGVNRISGGGWCTASDIRLASYRRGIKTAQPSGRFATLIALQP